MYRNAGLTALKAYLASCPGCQRQCRPRPMAHEVGCTYQGCPGTSDENFKEMCSLYVGGDQQDVPFRVQSGNAHPSYIGAMAYIVPEPGELSATAVTDSYVYLIDTARCVILAGHAFAPLLTDTALADAVDRAETALGIEFALWRRL